MAALSACKSGDDHAPVLAPTYGTEYIPLEVGRYIDYRFDSLDYNRRRSGLDTLRQGSVLERIAFEDTLSASGFQKAFALNILQRPDSTQNWRLARTGAAFLQFDGAYLVQDRGVLYELLTTPFAKGTVWNLNGYNTESQTGAYSLYFQGFDSDSSAIFAGDSLANCLGHQVQEVRFRKGIGLTFRRSDVAEYVPDTCPLIPRYQTQTIKRWTYLSSGKR